MYILAMMISPVNAMQNYSTFKILFGFLFAIVLIVIFFLFVYGFILIYIFYQLNQLNKNFPKKHSDEEEQVQKTQSSKIEVERINETEQISDSEGVVF
ncbi:unnamed protein product [Meloidogyne enterolobii]|uniref:Uncharacterized protein n=1 Tax=Meloidogyne enterolobii TaxID=390850 RepID=A0ACB0YXU2_MELEN